MVTKYAEWVPLSQRISDFGVSITKTVENLRDMKPYHIVRLNGLFTWLNKKVHAKDSYRALS